MALHLTLQSPTPTLITPTQWRRWFRAWWAGITPEDYIWGSRPRSVSLTLRLTDLTQMHDLNLTWRGLDQPTDVLAFAALEGLPPLVLPQVNLGDIAIGVPLAQTQALTAQHSLEQELAWLACHGFLHLLGWDHQDPASLEHMIQKQLTLLAGVGLEYGYHPDDAGDAGTYR